MKLHRTILVCALIAGATVALYLPILRADFVFDSRAQILVDDFIHDANNLGAVLSLQVLSREQMDSTRPMHLLSLMLDAAIWDRNPAGYHLTDILLHGGVVVLLLLFIAGEVGPAVVGAAAVGAAWFGLHPVNTETVFAISYREDLLVGLFTILSLLILQRCGQRRAAPLPAIVFVAICVFSVMSKESGLVTPFLGLAYLLLNRRRPAFPPQGDPASGENGRSWFVAAGIAAVLSIGFIVARFALAPDQHAVFVNRPEYPGGSFAKSLAITPRIWAFGLQLMIWPYGSLAANYGGISIAHIPLALAWVVIVVLATGAIGSAIKYARCRFALILIVLPLLPVSNLIPLHVAMADHFFYVSTMGLALLLAQVIAGVHASGRARRAHVLLVVCAAAVLGHAVHASQRRNVWGDRITLWSDTLKKTTTSFAAANNLGFASYDIGRYVDAVNAWHHALHVHDNMADAWAGLALGLDALRHDTEANIAYRRAIALDARYKDSTRLHKHLYWEAHYIERLEIVRTRVEKKDASQPSHVTPSHQSPRLRLGDHEH